MSSLYINDNSTNAWPNQVYGNYFIDSPAYKCASCGMSVGSYQFHYCLNQLTFPGLTPQQTEVQIVGGLIGTDINQKLAELEARVAELEDAVDVLERAELRSDNDQDEKVRIHSEEGCQGADERGSTEARDRKGDWYWPSKS